MLSLGIEGGGGTDEGISGDYDFEAIGESATPVNPKKVSNNYLEVNGIDAHDLKYVTLGKRTDISKYDIFVDRNGELWLQKKGTKEYIPTYENINE
jgi:hypothetical protein